MGANFAGCLGFYAKKATLAALLPPYQFLPYALVWFAISNKLLLLLLLGYCGLLLGYIVGCCARQWQAVRVGRCISINQFT